MVSLPPSGYPMTTVTTWPVESNGPVSLPIAVSFFRVAISAPTERSNNVRGTEIVLKTCQKWHCVDDRKLKSPADAIFTPDFIYEKNPYENAQRIWHVQIGRASCRERV